MLLRIENQYSYGLKISKPLVHQLKESHEDNLEALELQTMSRRRDSLLCNLLHVQLVNIVWLNKKKW